MIIIVAPEGRSGWYEITRPLVVTNRLNKTESNIIGLIELTNCVALAAGRISNAKTSINPTTWINNTTVSATIESNRM